MVFDKNYTLATEMLELSSNVQYSSGIKGLFEAVKRDISGEDHWFECKKEEFERFVSFLEKFEEKHSS